MPILTDDSLQVFMSLFRGRTDVFARRWEKNGKSGWSPAYDFNWQEFMAFKATGGTMKDFSNKKAIPISSMVIRSHFLGENTIGIYPLLADNTSYFIAADFDRENWEKEIKSFYKICTGYNIQFILNGPVRETADMHGFSLRINIRYTNQGKLFWSLFEKHLTCLNLKKR